MKTSFIIILVASVGYLVLTILSLSDLGYNITNSEPTVQNFENIQNIHLIEKENNNIIYEVMAREAFILQSNKSIMNLRDFTVIFYLATGREVTFIGRTGKIDSESKLFNIQDEAVIIDDLDRIMITSNLTASSITKFVVSDDPVLMLGPNFVIRGKGIKFDKENFKFTIQSDVTATVRK
ncbi:MAG: LPS export ABC transporter periplasmic protein LptC [Nitrospinota bacterium]